MLAIAFTKWKLAADVLSVAFIAMEWQPYAALLAIAFTKWQLVPNLLTVALIATERQLGAALLRPVAGLQGSTWVQ